MILNETPANHNLPIHVKEKNLNTVSVSFVVPCVMLFEILNTAL